MDTKLNQLEQLNKELKPPQELGGVFLPGNCLKQFTFMFIAKMPSMNDPKNKSGENDNFNFNVTARDRFLQEMMIKYGVGGSYVTDIVKERNIPRRPTETEIQKWLPFLLKEIEIIQPKAIIILGKTTYKESFKPSVEPFIPKEIKVDYCFHYSNRVLRNEFEQRFREVINRLRNQIEDNSV